MTAACVPLRVGFLGVGNIARDHAQALNALGHVVAAGCATSAESPRWREFQSLAPQASFVESGRALLEDPEIDAVIACLPWNVTETWLPELLTTPKPVLVEKPVALSSSAFSKAMDTSQARPDNKFVGYNRRFYRSVQRLKERVHQGGLKSVEITISETVGSLSAVFGPEIIDHILIYSSCHTLDTAVYLLGALHPVKVYGYQDGGYPRPFRSITGLLELDEGTPVFLSILADNPTPIGIRVFFDDQTTWHLSPLERLIAYKGYKRIEPTPEVNIRRYFPEPFLEINEDTEFKPGFLDQMKAFMGGEGRHIAATLAENLQLLRFVETLQRLSLGDGRLNDSSMAQVPPAAPAELRG